MPEDHYFIHDLMDCKVFDISGKKIGVIKDILQTGSNDVYVVDDNINNKEYLIPAVKAFVREVNIVDKKIIIDPIEGMIEWKSMFWHYFQSFFSNLSNWSIIGRAINDEILQINYTDIRDFSNNKHRKVDDYPFGGGPGMVMTPEPYMGGL